MKTKNKILTFLILLILIVLVLVLWWLPRQAGKSEIKLPPQNSVGLRQQNIDKKNKKDRLPVRNETKQNIKKKELNDVHHLIPPAEFKRRLDSGEYILVDIRTPEEYQKEHIPGTDLNLDFYAPDFEEKVKQLDRHKKYLYYCRTGHRSGLAGHYAEDLGFQEVYELQGGITAWKAAGYPVESGIK